jgi:hypothetical protein
MPAAGVLSQNEASLAVAKQRLVAADKLLDQKACEFSRLRRAMEAAAKDMAKEGIIDKEPELLTRLSKTIKCAADDDMEEWCTALEKRSRAHKEFLRAEEAVQNEKKSAPGDEVETTTTTSSTDHAPKKKAKKDVF